MTGGVEGAWWLPQSSKLLRPDDVGLGGFDSHALPPAIGGRLGGAPASIGARWRLFVTLCLIVLSAPAALAQGADSAARPPASIPRSVSDTTLGPTPVRRPPLSPGRSFAYSFLVPGSAQTALGRPRAR